MTAVRILAMAVILVMGLLAINILVTDGLGHGAGLDTFLAGAASPWQLFINQDLVSGLWLAIGWILYRQRGERPLDTLAWVWMILWWGNIVVASYVLVAARQAGGDPVAFFRGRHATAMRTAWPAPPLALRLVLIAAAVASLAWLAPLLADADEGIAVAGALLGLLPVVLSLGLLAFPRRTPLRPA